MSIVNVYPDKKEIHGRVRDGGVIAISVFEIPSNFRWPEEGEIWSVERDRLGGTQWILGSRIHHIQQEGEMAITEMDAGDLRLDSDVILDSKGRRLATLDDVAIGSGDSHMTFIQAVPSASWVIAHGLNKFPSVTVVDSVGNQVEGSVHYVDANNLTVSFISGFSGKAYLN